MHAQHGRLNGVKPAVQPHLVMVRRRARSVYAKAREAFGRGVVVRRHHAAVAVSAEVLGGEERGRPQIAPAAAAYKAISVLAPRPERLRAVLDDADAALFERRDDLLHFHHLAEQMHGHEGLRLRPDLFEDFFRRDVVAVRIDVGEHGRGAGAGDRADGGEERERRGDDLVAGLQVQCHQVEQQGVGA